MAKRSLFGSIQWLGDDRYRVYWTHEGERNSKVVRGTRDDAEIFLALMRTGRIPDQPWRSYYKNTVHPTFELLQPKTVEGYERTWDAELDHRIGDVMVGSTTRSFVQRVLLDIRATSVQRAALRLWKKMCNMAVGDGILASCPINRAIKLAPHVKREKHMLDVSELAFFLMAISKIKYRRLIWLMLGGGMSLEESSAGLAEDVAPWDFEGKRYALMRINKALPTVKGKKLLKGTKNDFREREMVMGEPFASLLLGDLPEEGPLCPSKHARRRDGIWKEDAYASPVTFTHNWRAWCEAQEMGYIRPGDMRSVWSTWQGEAGSLDSVVQMAMGHSDGSTRGRNYQENTRRSMAQIADNLTTLIKATWPKDGVCSFEEFTRMAAGGFTSSGLQC